ncbi:hypothetical protein AB0M80_19300 [Amycolatopsis sp. NPDC051045]|uniref:hypothetical protein n=1 Tax=Amycolatopsis sp. NPDC051045 TaxID=3156922 RepID=UPI00342506B3
MQTFETGLLDLTAIPLGELRVLRAPDLDSAIAGERHRAEQPDEDAVQVQANVGNGFGIPA